MVGPFMPFGGPLKADWVKVSDAVYKNRLAHGLLYIKKVQSCWQWRYVELTDGGKCRQEFLGLNASRSKAVAIREAELFTASLN